MVTVESKPLQSGPGLPSSVSSAPCAMLLAFTGVSQEVKSPSGVPKLPWAVWRTWRKKESLSDMKSYGKVKGFKPCKQEPLKSRNPKEAETLQLNYRKHSCKMLFAHCRACPLQPSLQSPKNH